MNAQLQNDFCLSLMYVRQWMHSGITFLKGLCMTDKYICIPWIHSSWMVRPSCSGMNCKQMKSQIGGLLDCHLSGTCVTQLLLQPLPILFLIERGKYKLNQTKIWEKSSRSCTRNNRHTGVGSCNRGVSPTIECHAYDFSHSASLLHHFLYAVEVLVVHGTYCSSP